MLSGLKVKPHPWSMHSSPQNLRSNWWGTDKWDDRHGLDWRLDWPSSRWEAVSFNVYNGMQSSWQEAFLSGNPSKPHSADLLGSTASPGGGHCPLESTASNIWLWQTGIIVKNTGTSNSTNTHQHVLPKTKCVDNGNWGEKEGNLSTGTVWFHLQ